MLFVTQRLRMQSQSLYNRHLVPVFGFHPHGETGVLLLGHALSHLLEHGADGEVGGRHVLQQVLHVDALGVGGTAVLVASHLRSAKGEGECHI